MEIREMHFETNYFVRRYAKALKNNNGLGDVVKFTMHILQAFIINGWGSRFS
jgi:hypothetical protein